MTCYLHPIIDVLHIMQFYDEEVEVSFRNNRIFALEVQIGISSKHYELFTDAQWEVVDNQWSRRL